MRAGKRIAAIISVLNESASLAHLWRGLPDWIDEVIVVDDDLSDSSAATVTSLGARMIAAPGRGYGSTCAAGVAATDADILLFLDSDGGNQPLQADRLVDPVASGTVDLVIGSRVLSNRDPGLLNLQQRFGNALACWLMRRIWRAHYTDLSPFRAIRRSTLLTLNLRNHGIGWIIEMQIRAHRLGFLVAEVPVDDQPPLRGMVLSAWHILGTVAAEIRRPD